MDCSNANIPTCVIAANGVLDITHILTKQVIEKASFLVACDGAAAVLDKYGYCPDAIVGDLDSIDEELRIRYSDRLVHVVDQEINDLTKAINYVHELGYKQVVIVGATGKRDDHTLANIALLNEFAPLFDVVEILTPYGIFTPIMKTTTFDSFAGQQISLFPLPPFVPISVHQLRYPVDHCVFSLWWQGALNEALGRHFTIELHGSSTLIVYRVHSLSS